MNVLVVEDDPTDLKLVRSVLMAEGHSVVGARSAEQALAMLAESRPDVIVTDLALPELDGVALAMRIKAAPETAHIPIVATTAYADRFQRGGPQLKAGFAAFVPKPIDTRALPALIAAVGGHS